MYYSPKIGDYVGPNEGCPIGTYGFTYQYSIRLIALCPLSWENGYLSLSDLRSGVETLADGTRFDVTVSAPGTLLHELLHMLGEGKF